MTTRVAGKSAEIWRAASIPPPGMATSSRARSGVCSFTARTAATASPTLATTARSSSAASVARRPSRKSGWSSATTIRIVSGIFVFAIRGFCEGQEDADASPTTAARLQLESAAQQLGPLAHAGQPEMALDRPLPDVEAGTFVAHLGHERAIGRLGDPDLDARSAAMACGVGQGLEEDAVQGDLRGERRPIGNPGHVHGCVQAGSALVFGHSPPHYLGRRRSLQLGRTKPRGDGPHVAEGVGERSAYAGEVLPATLAGLLEMSLHGVETQHGEGEGLRWAIVQVGADATPFQFVEGRRPLCGAAEPIVKPGI